MARADRPRRTAGAVVATLYLLGVAGTAVAAQVTRETRWYAAAILLTLPFGLLATVGVYLVYGLVDSLVVVLEPHLDADGVGSRVFALTTGIDVALFIGAGVANLVLLHRVRGRSHGSAGPRLGT